ncbi:hypothetical protein XH92_34795 [Bradyrhizobium sp. CCBAU 53421]|nr:hypothetical protein XH92_34795 [Bradyrhizobium sp. CCBAU 53421]
MLTLNHSDRSSLPNSSRATEEIDKVGTLPSIVGATLRSLGLSSLDGSDPKTRVAVSFSSDWLTINLRSARPALARLNHLR